MRERRSKEWSGLVYMQLKEFHADIFALCPVFFRTALLCSGGYLLVKGWMPLHGAVWIKCKKGVTAENQGADIKHMG